MMTEPGWMQGPPRRILLATDMSCRCDRALDRAVQLAGEWDAKLLVVHAVAPVDTDQDSRRFWDMPSWRQPPDRVKAVRERLYMDLLDHPVNIDVHVDVGDPAEIILAAAKSAGSDLIITGVARDEPFGRRILGDTVDRLMNKTPAPLLIVRSRPRHAYRNIVVATDFSPSSRHALEAAVRFFPKAAFTLFTGYEIPFAGILDRVDIRRELRHMEDDACGKFLKEANVDPALVSRMGKLIEYGAPEMVLRNYAQEKPVDLTVVGSHGGGAIYHIVIGSTARRIIDAVPGDVLLVREPKAG